MNMITKKISEHRVLGASIVRKFVTVYCYHTLNILSLCNAEEGGDVAASLTDDNAADDDIGSADLECIAYSAMTLLPYSDESFSCYQRAGNPVRYWAADSGRYNI